MLTLRDAGVKVIDCEHRTPAAASDGFPYITIPNMREGRIDPAGARLMSSADLASWNRKADPRDHDVVLSRRTNPGETAVAPSGLRYALGQNLVILRADGSRLFPPFLRWLVRGPAWWEQIGRFLNVGAVFDSLKVSDIPNFALRVPSLPEQECIAGVLDALDDKIESNRRMSETLETMARTLFKSWFVDFDPVRAKMDGRDLGVPEPIAELFPSSLVDSNIGAIPMGWDLSTLGDEVGTILGGTPSRAVPSYWNGDVPWINSAKANEFRVVEPSEFITREGLASSATKMLPSRTTIIAITGATLGQVSLTEIATCANQSIVGVLGSERMPSEFLYLWISRYVNELVAKQTGGAQQHINKNDVNELAVLCPKEPVMHAFISAARPLFDRIKGCCLESRTLKSTRDALLPKLISGDLRVKDVERVAVEASV